MSYTSGVIVWIYLVGATLGETLLFYAFPGVSLFEGVIGVLAATNGIVTMIVSMRLKDEPRTLQYFLLVPIVLLAILLLAIVFDYPTG